MQQKPWDLLLFTWASPDAKSLLTLEVSSVSAPEVNRLCPGPQVEGLQGVSRHSVVPQYSPSTDKERIRARILLSGAESKSRIYLDV